MSKLNGESQTDQILFVYLHGEEGGEKVRERANNTFPERMLMMTMVGVKQLSVAGVEVVVF